MAGLIGNAIDASGTILTCTNEWELEGKVRPPALHTSMKELTNLLKLLVEHRAEVYNSIVDCCGQIAEQYTNLLYELISHKRADDLVFAKKLDYLEQNVTDDPRFYNGKDLVQVLRKYRNDTHHKTTHSGWSEDDTSQCLLTLKRYVKYAERALASIESGSRSVLVDSLISKATSGDFVGGPTCKGTVTKFNSKQNFGFIRRADNGESVYFHASHVRPADFGEGLDQGIVVQFHCVESSRAGACKYEARNISVLERPALVSRGPMVQCVGRIISFDAERKFGFIRGSEHDVFFHVSQVATHCVSLLKENVEVEFMEQVKRKPGHADKYEALQVKVRARASSTSAKSAGARPPPPTSPSTHHPLSVTPSQPVPVVSQPKLSFGVADLAAVLPAILPSASTLPSHPPLPVPKELPRTSPVVPMPKLDFSTPAVPPPTITPPPLTFAPLISSHTLPTYPVGPPVTTLPSSQQHQGVSYGHQGVSPTPLGPPRHHYSSTSTSPTYVTQPTLSAYPLHHQQPLPSVPVTTLPAYTTTTSTSQPMYQYPSSQPVTQTWPHHQPQSQPTISPLPRPLVGISSSGISSTPISSMPIPSPHLLNPVIGIHTPTSTPVVGRVEPNCEFFRQCATAAANTHATLRDVPAQCFCFHCFRTDVNTRRIGNFTTTIPRGFVRFELAAPPSNPSNTYVIGFHCMGQGDLLRSHCRPSINVLPCQPLLLTTDIGACVKKITPYPIPDNLAVVMLYEVQTKAQILTATSEWEVYCYPKQSDDALITAVLVRTQPV